jgi:hypothetical protein
MPKYLAVASYNSEGIKGLVKAGGTERVVVLLSHTGYEDVAHQPASERSKKR